MKFSESTISKKPEADIKTRIKASVVLFSIISEVCQNELNVKSKTRPISTLPTSANSSRRIFSEKYEETPSVKNNPNFKKIVNKVNKIPKNEISEEKILDIAIDAGAEECHSDNEIHEIHCEKNKIYEVKKKLEMTVKNFISTEIEWIPINNVIISKDIFDEISDFLDSLDNDDDVQNIFTNLKIGSN